MNELASPRAGRREWIGLAVLALPCLIYSMDLTVLNLAVPHLSADLRPTSAQLLWIVDVYGFVIAGSLVTMGTLRDRIGRRRLLLIGAAAFGGASVVAAFSTSAEMLIATRALLGLAGATLAPSTLSLIRAMFLDAEQRTFAIGVWVASFSAGAAIGPLLGGLLLAHFWWGSVLLLGVPVMVLLLILGPRLLPEHCDPTAGRLDLRSAGLSLAAVLAGVYALKQAAENGVGWSPLLFLAAGVGVGAAFVSRQRRLDDPLIDVRLFALPAFSFALVAGLLTIFVAMGAFLFIAQYLQLALELAPMRAGLWTLPWAGGLIAGSMLAPVLARRWDPMVVVASGFALAASGLGVLTQVGTGSGLGLLGFGMVVVSLGIALVIPLTTEMVVGSASTERAGAASAMSETATELGASLGIAVLGSIGTAVYRSDVAAGVPAGLPADVVQSARDTLGGAVALAHELSPEIGFTLIEAARDAFVRGMHVTAAISAVLAVGMAVGALAWQRATRAAVRGASDAIDVELDGADVESGLFHDEITS
jgi:DHA2 family multidrug resistance protein-like MFS transporter